MKPGEHFTLYYVQMLFSLHPAMNFPLPVLGCHHLGFLQCSPSPRAVLKSPACQSQLTGNGALEGAVMIKSNDGDLVGLRSRSLRCLTAMKTASHTNGNQATQEQQPTDHHHHPGNGEDYIRTVRLCLQGTFKVSPCLK